MCSSAPRTEIKSEFSASEILFVLHDVIFPASSILPSKKDDKPIGIIIVFHREHQCVQVLRELK
jgi:hypothetical protein